MVDEMFDERYVLRCMCKFEKLCTFFWSCVLC